MSNKNLGEIKILIIVGPTASGKSDLAVRLAKKFNGEVVSADSRQVYKSLDIGTGKITKKEMKGVRHHLLDVADPKKQFNVQKYKELAKRAITDIASRGKLPIICGGTGFYIDALLGDELPPVGPDEKLRRLLAGASVSELMRKLRRLNPVRAREIGKNPSDRKNPRRLIRAIEIAASPKNESIKTGMRHYEPSFIGLQLPLIELKEHIRARLLARLKQGMIREVKKLHERGLSWKRMEELGLEYRYLARFIQSKISREEMIGKLAIEINRYAKRQMTWWRRNNDIKWFRPDGFDAIGKYIKSRIARQ